MRIRSIAAAALVAAGLSVTLTGAAVADEPENDDDAVIRECAGAERLLRELPDEEREWLEAQPRPPQGRVFEWPDGPGERGDEIRVAPAPPDGGAEPVPPRSGVEPVPPGSGVEPAPLRGRVEIAPPRGGVEPAPPSGGRVHVVPDEPGHDRVLGCAVRVAPGG